MMLENLFVLMAVTFLPNFPFEGNETMNSTVSEKVLFDFENHESIKLLFITNDSVMGGISQSRLDWNQTGCLQFSGNVSLENNGGFASFRSKQMEFELKAEDCIFLRVKGDGKKYRISLGTDQIWNGVYYYHDFETQEGKWIDIVAPLTDFVPRFRGRIISNAPALNAENIKSVGIMIADYQNGDFAIEIDWIAAGLAVEGVESEE